MDLEVFFLFQGSGAHHVTIPWMSAIKLKGDSAAICSGWQWMPWWCFAASEQQHGVEVVVVEQAAACLAEMYPIPSLLIHSCNDGHPEFASQSP